MMYMYGLLKSTAFAIYMYDVSMMYIYVCVFMTYASCICMDVSNYRQALTIHMYV